MRHNLVNFCEFDKYAVKSYCAIHNETEEKNLGDITKVNIENLPKCDMITHGSPLVGICQIIKFITQLPNLMGKSQEIQ